MNIISDNADGSELWVSTRDGAVIRLSYAQGKILGEFKIASSEMGSIAFAPNGKTFVAYAIYGKFAIYDASTRRPVETLEPPPSAVYSQAFTPDGRFVYGGADDGAIRVWSLETGKIVATFVSFRDGTWAVADPEGRFDASNGGDVKGLFWLIGDTPIDLAQLKSYYYDPHLLAKILGLNPEKPREVPDLTGVTLCPEVAVAYNATTKTARVTVTDLGGGIGPTDLFLNGVKIASHAAPASTSKVESFTVDVSASMITSRLLPVAKGDDHQLNRLEAVAYNRGGSLKSRLGTGVDLSGVLTAPPSNLFAIVAGDNYSGTNRTLRYPV